MPYEKQNEGNPSFFTPYSLVIDYSHWETMLVIGGNFSLASDPVVHSLSPGGR